VSASSIAGKIVGTEDIERLRRSIALLTPGQPAGLSTEEAMAMLADLRSARRHLERLIAGLRQLLDSTGRIEGP